MLPLVSLLLSAWPAPDATLKTLELPVLAASARRLRVVIDAGHGTATNVGNEGCLCQLEKDHALAVADALAEALPRLGPFEVRRTRSGTKTPEYRERIRVADAWRPDVIISLHSDARGFAWPWNPYGDHRTCSRNDVEPGFAVLWSEDGAAGTMFSRREALGRAVVRRMVEAGFRPYSGENYGGLYRPDLVAGGWIDIRVHGKNVYFLRASDVAPTIIIETHHALDLQEVKRWDEPQTTQAFLSAVAAALVDLLPAK